MTHNINIGDDLWPIPGEFIRYIWPDTYSFRYEDLQLTHNNEYEVIAISYLPCCDRIKLADDVGHTHWVELRKFSFLDFREEFNKGNI